MIIQPTPIAPMIGRDAWVWTNKREQIGVCPLRGWYLGYESLKGTGAMYVKIPERTAWDANYMLW